MLFVQRTRGFGLESARARQAQRSQDEINLLEKRFAAIVFWAAFLNRLKLSGMVLARSISVVVGELGVVAGKDFPWT